MKISPEDRSAVIEAAIDLETHISILITAHFFPNQPLPFKFLHGVLGDPYANTAFKLSVFLKFYPTVPSKVADDARRAFAIRNIFAHCGLEVTHLLDPEKSGILDPKKLNTPLDIALLKAEFEVKRSNVKKHLDTLLMASGIPREKVDPSEM